MNQHLRLQGIALAALLTMTPVAAGAHVIPLREGMPRIEGFGHCAKGPCLRVSDFSTTVPHVHRGEGPASKVTVCGSAEHLDPFHLDPVCNRVR
jgi:hypothetical protein